MKYFLKIAVDKNFEKSKMFMLIKLIFLHYSQVKLTDIIIIIIIIRQHSVIIQQMV